MLYPLSPLQQGMLSQALRSPGDGVNVEQVLCSLREELAVPAFEEAWRRTVDRHEVLRTAFCWKDLPEPMQRIVPGAELPFHFEDWSADEAGERQRKFDEFLESDRLRGFRLDIAPLVRVALFRLGGSEYRFVATFHHTVIDGRSLVVVVRDLWTFYDAIVAGVEPKLPPAPQGYREYIGWLGRKEIPSSEKYWRETFAGFAAAPSVELPRRGEDRPVHYDHTFLIPKETTAALTAAAAAFGVFGVTVNTFVQAAWAVLLSRYSREEDIVFGGVRASRHFGVPGAGGMVGLFINTLPMRAKIEPGLPLIALLKNLRSQQIALRNHEFTPLVDIQRWTGVAPLFRSIIVFDNTTPNVALGVPATRDVTLRERTGYPLSLYCWGGPELALKIAADASFEPAAVARMAGHLATLLEGMSRHGANSVGSLPMLTEEEEKQFAGWNATHRDFSSDRCVHNLVQSAAARSPAATAVTFGKESLDYRGLNARANQLARHLQSRGVKPGDLVGLCVERSCEMIVAMLGILKAGAAYVPLDPAYPRERIAHMVADSGAALIVTQSSLSGALPAGGAALLAIDLAWPEIAGQSGDDLPSVVSPGSVAYVIYTSGSTGRPKGIAIEHRAVVNFLESMRREPGLCADDTLLAVTTISFDIAALEIFLPLVTGARILLADRETSSDPARLAALLDRATVMQATPATWRMLVQSGWSGSPALKILCGGEAIAPELARELLTRCSALWNMYGPTETTIWSTCHRIENAAPPIPVGRPIANTTIHVLGKDRQPVPVDVAGELCIGGAGLARGYHNLPELTREKFTPDPFSAEPGARLYATGDLSRIAPDGTIEVLGRIDRQIKIRGFRIEAGEIETRLNEFPAVSQSAVIDRADAAGEKILAAYYVAGSANIPAAELRAFLAGRLPAYMVPSVFVALERLPLTPNGKVDYRALPAPVMAPANGSPDFTPPRSATEEKLAGIWAGVLHRERVDVRDNFFDLGGHSLTATVLAMRINSAFGVDFPLGRIFEQPVFADIAGVIDRLAPRADDGRQPMRPDPAHAHDPFPLTDLQHAYVTGRSKGFSLGNIALHAYVEFEPEFFDAARANAAVQTLIARHPMLRAVVREDGSQQVLERTPVFEITVVDLRGKTPGEVEAFFAAARERMSHTVFDLHCWPWFEIRDCRLDEGRHRLFVSYDATMLDAWSAHLLVREFASLMSGATLPVLDATFRDYVLAEAASRDAAAFRNAKEYWTGRLAELPAPPSLPLAKSPDAVEHPGFTRHSMRLAPDEWEQFKSRAASRSITPGAALIAAYSEVLARWSQGRRFLLSLPVFDRVPFHPRINEVAGHFTSISLLDVDFTRGGSFEDRSRALQQQLWNDLDHRAYNGVLVARDLARLRGNAFRNAPIVTTNIMLDEGFQSAFPGRVEFAVTQTPQVLLDQMAAVSGGALIVWWDAVAELFPAGMLGEMFASFSDLVSRLAGEDAAWSEAASPARIPQSLPAGPACGESDELLHTLFVKQVAARDGEPAVIAPARTLTYGELHRRASRVAEILREAGVQPNTLVAIVMSKGWEQIVAALGILYSGAAYVPVVATLPAGRIEHLLRHCNVKIALTQSEFEHTVGWPEDIRTICVDREGESHAIFDAPVQSRDDLAYVIHTSGSTGLPKGVMIDHRGAVNTILDINSRFRVTPADRVFALSSLSFDLSVYDVFGTLAAGGAIVIPGADDAFDPAHWAALLERHGVTIWNSVPALMKMLVDYAAGRPAAVANQLRLVMLSGDWIPLALPGQIRAVAHGAEIISLGGATEASIWSILFPVDDVDPAWKSIPYGRAMVNQSFHVLDKSLEECPVWVPGGLYIGGIGLAKGYWNDAEKTAASFIRHPRTGERLYRTGDLGRLLPDGNIEFLGREDFQVKIQGLRIELEEIETVLLQHPALSAAVVAARGERDGPKRLIAYYVPKAAAPTANELRDFLLAKLPDYMVPLAFVALDALPLTANGKIDRPALPEPEIKCPETSAEPPRTPLEEKLAAIWMQALGIDRISIRDDFIALGGDSLRGLRIVNRLRELLGEQLSPVIIFDAPTIEALAQLLEKNYPAKAATLGGGAVEKTPGDDDATKNHPRLAPIPVAARDLRRIKRSALHG